METSGVATKHETESAEDDDAKERDWQSPACRFGFESDAMETPYARKDPHSKSTLWNPQQSTESTLAAKFREQQGRQGDSENAKYLANE